MQTSPSSQTTAVPPAQVPPEASPVETEPAARVGEPVETGRAEEKDSPQEESSETSVPPDAPTIEAINTEDGIAVISVGRDGGAAIGLRYSVHRNGREIGRLEVTDLYPDLAGARILSTEPGEKLATGDTLMPLETSR